MLEAMLKSMTMRFQTIGLYIQETKTIWTSTCRAHLDKAINICGVPVDCADPDNGLPILGSQISFSRSLGCDHNHRVAQAWKAFWKISPILMDKAINIKVRFRIFHLAITPCALWGLSSSTCTDALLDALDVAQTTMMCKMLRMKRRPDEGWLDWFRRSRRPAKQWNTRLQHQMWSQRLVCRTLQWAGQVARYDEQHIMHHLLRYRCFEWWRYRQDWIQLGYADARHKGRFRDHRRWEEPLETFKTWCIQHKKAEWHHIPPNVPWRALAQHADQWDRCALQRAQLRRPDP
jgi:hypothetical protein